MLFSATDTTDVTRHHTRQSWLAAGTFICKDALTSLNLAFSGPWAVSSMGLGDLDACFSVLVERMEENQLLTRKQ